MSETDDQFGQWPLRRLGDLGEWTGGGTPSKGRAEFWEGGTIPWVSPKDMKTPVINSAQDSITTTALKESSAKLIPAGSVLVVTRSGILEHTLPIARTRVGVAVNQDLKALTPSDEAAPEYLAYALNGHADEILRTCSKTGTTVASVVTDQLMDFEIPLPDIETQRTIVQSLDAHFSRLSAAGTNLERAKANLDRYRASVLQAACKGLLVPTEAEIAHREGREYESADELLSRILAERRARWETEEAEKLKAKGKEPKNDRWKEKFKQPEGPDTSELPELPEGWTWAVMGQIAEVIGGLTKNRKRAALDSQVPYLRVANVYANELVLDEVKTIGVKDPELDRVLLEEGDLLIVEGNGSLDQIGRVAMWDGSIEPCAHQNHLIKARLVEKEMAEFVLYWLLSKPGRLHITKVASSTSGLYTLSLSKVSKLPVPLPPLSEQRRIVEAIDTEVTLAQGARREVEAASLRSDRLRRSVLRRAFRGGLTTPEHGSPGQTEA